MTEPTQSRSNDEDLDAKSKAAGLLPSHGISLNLPTSSEHERPAAVRHMSQPTYYSPLRHHRRASSRTKHVKETFNARSHYGSSSDDGGAAIHRVNQYIIKQEIGRGSFGSVHLAEDQYGIEYAVKEFSKSRLRKRAASSLLRKGNQKRPSQHLTAGGFNTPLSRVKTSDKSSGDANNSFDLIKEEIAVMKKLNHNNLVSLIEVLDDPEEDSLYMVLEMCKKGVVMQVGLDETADPYEDETCRCWFRDMVLGIEYLHAQGIIHRDLKPDNCLINDEDVLKIVDFGVSEMFEKESSMHTAKSAGSPAFMPPELCKAGHGQISGRAADIWSMGVTLYCLRYGKIPFERHVMLELYEAIREDEPDYHKEDNENFKGLMRRLLEKDPNKRITMKEVRIHPWVTKNGSDPLLPEEENCSDIVEPPTEQEMNNAITGNMSNLMVVMKAVKRFKKLLVRKRPELMEGIFGRGSKIVMPPGQLRAGYGVRQSRSHETANRVPLERGLATEGIHHDLSVSKDNSVHPKTVDSTEGDGQPAPCHDHEADPALRQEISHGRQVQITETSTHQPQPRHARTFSRDDPGRGHAHDPLTDTLFLDIGPGIDQQADTSLTVSESPGNADDNIYEEAYKQEVERIMQRRGKAASMYLTRRVEHKDELRSHTNIIDDTKAVAMSAFSRLGMGNSSSSGAAKPAGGFASLINRAKGKAADDYDEKTGTEGGAEESNSEAESAGGATEKKGEA